MSSIADVAEPLPAPGPALDRWVEAARPPQARPDGTRAAAFVEPERTRMGTVEQAATVFVVNRECPFRCLMCDLWKGTTEGPVPAEAIGAQIEAALGGISSVRHVKLYNAGSWFDPLAVPVAADAAVARLLAGYSNVVVESHPAFVGDRALGLRDLLGNARLEVAIGLETCHPETLARLNKRMTVEDYERASRFLRRAGIFVRTFVLLRPPFTGEEEGAVWALRSIETALEAGSDCVVVIPVRGGNGAMERLAGAGAFAPPSAGTLERVLADGIGLAYGRGRVFADLWDFERLAGADSTGRARLERMNLEQGS